MSTDYRTYLAASEGLKAIEDEEKEAALITKFETTPGVTGRYLRPEQRRSRSSILGVPGEFESLLVYSPQRVKLFEQSSTDRTSQLKRQSNEGFSSKEKRSEAMTDSIADEIKRMVSAIEERMDKRIERIEKDTDRRSEEFRREMELRDAALKRDTDALRELMKTHAAHTEKMGERLEGQFAEAKSAIGAQKYWLAGIGVAVVLGIMGANATIFSGGKAFFDGGVDHATVKQLLEETKAQSLETRALLESLKVQQATPPTPAPPASTAKPAPAKP